MAPARARSRLAAVVALLLVRETWSSCRACRLHGERAPLLYIIERKDGPGSTLHNLIYALGAAARNGMNFGGVVSRGPHLNKGVNVTSMVVRALSIDDPDATFRERHFERTFGSLAKLERAAQYAPEERVLLTAHSMVKEQGLEGVRKTRPNVTLDEYLSPRVLERLRGCQLPWVVPKLGDASPDCPPPRHQKRRHRNGPLKVVMHARRGDHAGAADAEFFRAARAVREVAPDADLHVYSLVEGFNASRFEAHRFTVHADDVRTVEADLLFDVWTAFATADVLVVDTSSFSWAPAFFNPNCVIFHPYSLHYASDRLVLTDWVPSTDEPRLRDCVRNQLLDHSRKKPRRSRRLLPKRAPTP